LGLSSPDSSSDSLLEAAANFASAFFLSLAAFLILIDSSA